MRRLIELGGSHADIGQTTGTDHVVIDGGHVVLADPEGNEFCVLAPGNSFLAGCGRLRAINCDGSQATGHFWSEVLGLPLVWDQDEETALRLPTGIGPMIKGSGPPLLPKSGRNRLLLAIAADEQEGAVERLLALGASRVDEVKAVPGWVLMADPDGNEFRVETP